MPKIDTKRVTSVEGLNLRPDANVVVALATCTREGTKRKAAEVATNKNKEYVKSRDLKLRPDVGGWRVITKSTADSMPGLGHCLDGRGESGGKQRTKSRHGGGSSDVLNYSVNMPGVGYTLNDGALVQMIVPNAAVAESDVGSFMTTIMEMQTDSKKHTDF